MAALALAFAPIWAVMIGALVLDAVRWSRARRASRVWNLRQHHHAMAAARRLAFEPITADEFLNT